MRAIPLEETTDSSSTALSNLFWKDFHKSYWNKKPGVFKDVFKDPFFQEDDLFQTLRIAADRKIRTLKPVEFRFYLGEESLNFFEDYRHLLPNGKDQSLLRYSDRIQRELKGAEWGMVFNSIHLYSPRVWEKARDLAYRIFRYTGLPGSHISVDAFLGNYARTPFGVHKDRLDVFTFPIVGKKMFKLWPFESLAGHFGVSKAMLYEGAVPGIRDRSVKDFDPLILEACPGDMIYWPSSFWHVGCGGSGLNATIVFGVGSTRDLGEWIGTKVSRPTSLRLQPSKISAKNVDVAAKRFLRQCDDTMRGYIGSLKAKEIKATFRDEIYKRVSAMSFYPYVDMMDDFDLGENDFLEMDPRFPMTYYIHGQSIHLFANGRKITLRNSKSVVELIGRLHRGGIFTVQQFVQEYQNAKKKRQASLEPKELHAFLKALVRFRVLKRSMDS